MLAHQNRAQLPGTPERTRPAQLHNRRRNPRRHRPAVTPRRPGALRKPARALLTIPAEPLVARLPADPVRRAKRRHRRLAPMPRQNKIQLLVHPTGLSPGHSPVLPELPLTCHPSIRSNLLPIYPVCTVSNPPLRPVGPAGPTENETNRKHCHPCNRSIVLPMLPVAQTLPYGGCSSPVPPEWNPNTFPCHPGRRAATIQGPESTRKTCAGGSGPRLSRWSAGVTSWFVQDRTGLAARQPLPPDRPKSVGE